MAESVTVEHPVSLRSFEEHSKFQQLGGGETRYSFGTRVSAPLHVMRNREKTTPFARLGAPHMTSPTRTEVKRVTSLKRLRVDQVREQELI